MGSPFVLGDQDRVTENLVLGEVYPSSPVKICPNKLTTQEIPNQTSKRTLATPIKVNRLKYWLTGYDNHLKNYLLQGFTEGFDIGFSGDIDPIEADNLKSANQLPHMVEEKLRKELKASRFAGPFEEKPFTNMFISPLGLVEKKIPGTYRLIHHLSYPEGRSVNDHIPPEHTHVQYSNIEDAINSIKQLGKGCFMAKTDIDSAFRIIPVSEKHYHLLGFKWRQKWYYDRNLPMGLASSCKIFETFSIAIAWIARQKLGISELVKILDDFLILDTSYQGCEKKLKAFLFLCNDIGIPIAQEKTFHAAQTMQFVGYELKSEIMEVRLPLEKITKCHSLIEKCLTKSSLTLRNLQSIIGTLNFCCAVIIPGRAFLRRLIDLTIGVSKPYYYIKITKEVKQDLFLWNKFLKKFNGKSLFLPDRWLQSPAIQLFTDSSGVIGYGGMLGPKWFYGLWDSSWRGQNIALLELYPIMLAMEIWGQDLANKCISFHTDNAALVEIINKQTSKDKKIMYLVRKLVLKCLEFNILFHATHIRGVDNSLADYLSRQQIDSFKALAPHADQHPTPVPPLPPLPP